MLTYVADWRTGLGVLLLALVAVLSAPTRELVQKINVQLWPFPSSSSSDTSQSPFVRDHKRKVTYVGSHSYAVEQFQNIFYGQDTSGANRFAPPVPFEYSAGSVVDATKSGAWCPQGTGVVLPFTSEVTNISENCLSLRIARPNDTRAGDRLPVMVWVHGGGHALGSSSDILYEPGGLVAQAAADQRPLIWVAINYRLSFFGFATSRALLDAGHTNAGLRDQRLAFEWVRDNIEVFGGDPGKITAIGQSVGASDISLQMLAFGGKSRIPFHQAILMSGAPGLNFNTKSDLVSNNTMAVAQEAGCVNNGDGQSEETLKCLRDAPFELLTDLSITSARAARPPFGEGFFFPTFDGDFIQRSPSEQLREGKIAQGIPVLAEWSANDGAWYASPTTTTDKDVLTSFGQWLFGLSEATNTKLLELYSEENFAVMVRPGIDIGISPQYYRAAQMNRDIWFTCPIIDFAWQYLKHGGVRPSQVRVAEHNSTRFAPVYAAMGVPQWRVAHLSDIPYVLNSQNIAAGGDNSAAALELSRSISRSIAKFVTSGDPDGVPGLESWPPAFADATSPEREQEGPGRLTLGLKGGLSWNTAVTIGGETQAPKSSAEVQKALEWERLLERCSFINSQEFRAEAGV